MKNEHNDVVENVLEKIKKTTGAQAEVFREQKQSFNVRVRNQKMELFENSTLDGIGLRIYHKGGVALVHSSDISPARLDHMIETGMEAAENSTSDTLAVLPTTNTVVSSLMDFQNYDSKWNSLPVEEKVEMAMRAEREAMKADNRIIASAGAGFSYDVRKITIADTNGMRCFRQATTGHISCHVIARQGGFKHDGHHSSSARFYADLDSPEDIGRKAAAKAVRILNPKQVSSRSVPIVMENEAASEFLALVFQALSGEKIMRGRSFFPDDMDEAGLSPLLTVYDDPGIERGLGSVLFDAEGIPARRKVVIEKGVVKHYFYDSYFARRARRPPSGNTRRFYYSPPEIGASNFYLTPGRTSRAEIIASVEQGLYVTNFFGFGCDITTGAFSQGAEGLLIEGGRLGQAVSGVTISGNMLEMLRDIEMIGNDLETRFRICSPTIKIGKMTISGPAAA